jgi:drug/metabolite transporter (DMT)-like permease
LAFVLAAMTFQRGNAAVGSALIGLSPGVSIALAWKLLNERLWPIQIIGAALGALTVILFALAA